MSGVALRGAMADQLNPNIGIVCALPVELAAVTAVFEIARDSIVNVIDDPLTYAVAELESSVGGSHQLVIALMPEKGNNHAAAVAAHMRRSFPGLEQLLMVGIAAGCPRSDKGPIQVRLGDVVVVDERGVCQFDKGRQVAGRFEVTDTSPKPSARLLLAARQLQAQVQKKEYPWESYLLLGQTLKGGSRPPSTTDPRASRRRQEPDVGRRKGVPLIHQGRIASSNLLLKDAKYRDELVRREKIVAIEMEASGVADSSWLNDVPYFVVRGICDYANRLKNDRWHAYAAVAAAAYARALLEVLPGRPDTRASGGPDAPSAGPTVTPSHGGGRVTDYTRRVQPIVDYHIESFVGREATIEWARALPWSSPDQYVGIVDAPPGFGKTALSASILQASKSDPDWPIVVPFFVSQRRSDDTPYDFLRAVLPALTEVAQVPTADAADYLGLQAQLDHCWSRIVADPPGCGLILLVDALDEQATAAERISDLLPLATAKGVAVLVTSRPQPSFIKHLSREHPLRSATAHTLDHLSSEEVTGVVRRVLPRRTSESTHRTVYELTDGNPLFVRLVLDELRSSRSTTIEDIAKRGPDAVESYIREEVSSHLVSADESARQLLALFAMTPASLSVTDAAAVLGLTPPAVEALMAPFARLFVEQEGELHIHHPEVARVIVETLGDTTCTDATERLFGWIEGYRNREWPEDTPAWIVRSVRRLFQRFRPDQLVGLVDADWARLHRHRTGALGYFIEDVRAALQWAQESGRVDEAARLSNLLWVAKGELVALPGSAIAALLLLRGPQALPSIARSAFGDDIARNDAVHGYSLAARSMLRSGRLEPARRYAGVLLSEALSEEGIDWAHFDDDSGAATAATLYVEAGGVVSQETLAKVIDNDGDNVPRIIDFGAALARQGQWVGFDTLRASRAVDLVESYDALVEAGAAAAALRGEWERANELVHEVGGWRAEGVRRELVDQVTQEIEKGRTGNALEVLRGTGFVEHWDIAGESMMISLVSELAHQGNVESALGVAHEVDEPVFSRRLVASALASAQRSAIPSNLVSVAADVPDVSFMPYVGWRLDAAVVQASRGDREVALRLLESALARFRLGDWDGIQFDRFVHAATILDGSADGLVDDLYQRVLDGFGISPHRLRVEVLIRAIALLSRAFISNGWDDQAEMLVTTSLERWQDSDERDGPVWIGQLALTLAQQELPIHAAVALQACVKLFKTAIPADVYFDWLCSTVPVAALHISATELQAWLVGASPLMPSPYSAQALTAATWSPSVYEGLDPFDESVNVLELRPVAETMCTHCAAALLSEWGIFHEQDEWGDARPDEEWSVDDADFDSLVELAAALVRRGEHCAARIIINFMPSYLRCYALSEAFARLWDDEETGAALAVHEQIDDPDTALRALELAAWTDHRRSREQGDQLVRLAEASFAAVRNRALRSTAALRMTSITGLQGDRARARDYFTQAHRTSSKSRMIIGSPQAYGRALAHMTTAIPEPDNYPWEPKLDAMLPFEMPISGGRPNTLAAHHSSQWGAMVDGFLEARACLHQETDDVPTRWIVRPEMPVRLLCAARADGGQLNAALMTALLQVFSSEAWYALTKLTDRLDGVPRYEDLVSGVVRGDEEARALETVRFAGGHGSN